MLLDLPPLSNLPAITSPPPVLFPARESFSLAGDPSVANKSRVLSCFAFIRPSWDFIGIIAWSTGLFLLLGGVTNVSEQRQNFNLYSKLIDKSGIIHFLVFNNELIQSLSQPYVFFISQIISSDQGSMTSK